METKNLPYPRSLGRLLGFASGATNAFAQKLLNRHDLSLAQWIILSALWRQDGLLISEIAAYYRVKTPAASRIVDRMIGRGLVERRPDPNDRRAARVYLTRKARDLSHLIDFYEDVNTALLTGFSKDEREQLFRFLERITENANARKSDRTD